MEESTTAEQEKMLALLSELVLDHLGIPRPGANDYIQELQNQLLPEFMESARYSWIASSPYQPPRTTNDPPDPILNYLHNATETNVTRIERLNEILEGLGVDAVLDELSTSHEAANLGQIKLDSYEERLLQAAGHPSPKEAALEYLRLAVQNPSLMSNLDETLEKAVLASLSAHRNITNIININIPPQTAVSQADSTAKKPKRRKVFTGLGTLFSGLTLLAGNSILIPSIPMTAVTAIPIIGSLAGGIAATGKGIGELLGEGEEQQPSEPVIIKNNPGSRTSKS